ncbi:hypothetical protein QAD02_002571 [Eretmocerus hayati]|uniref:Uncharacterized protein n=1 Tax=Eretmocerus hayati TaxID=131215 RepID=A0ACC2NJR1_9HYME|nr:hypothetical protein QAD02_002571 [Eretmocerus hayati]
MDESSTSSAIRDCTVKQFGRVYKQCEHARLLCPASRNNNPENDPVSNAEEETLDDQIAETQSLNHESIENNEKNDEETVVQTGVKRPLSSAASTTSSNMNPVHENNSSQEIKPKPTKISKLEGNKLDIQKYLQPAKEYIDHNTKSWPLTYDKLLEFLESTQGMSEDAIGQQARSYCSDMNELNEMLSSVYPHLGNRTLKARITRIGRIITPASKLSPGELEDVELFTEEDQVEITEPSLSDSQLSNNAQTTNNQ